jgi:pyrroloquinoline quinone biosynthesis protein B
MLNRVPDQAQWSEFSPGESFELKSVRGEASGLRVEAISLGTHFPAYVNEGRRAGLQADEASLGFVISDPAGKSVGYFPAVPAMDETLLARLLQLDLLFFDGTFWSDDELIRIQGSGQTARQMGHMPVGGPDGSLARLRGVACPRKMFVHVNNTNPMLDEFSAECRAVREAGWEIAEDGWQCRL